MPERDGTGPMERGSMSGRGLGVCIGARSELGMGQGMGFGRGRGLGRKFIVNPTDCKTQKELLEEQKKLFESRLAIIGKQLESL